jgi:NifU-like protein involved in Fe-S cluster formation
MGIYSETVWLHFNNPRNVGCLEAPCVEGFAGGERSGPFTRFTARLRGEVIEEVRFQTYGCAPAIAACSLLSEAVCGKTLTAAQEWDVPKLLTALGGLPEDKRHCAELAIEALGKLTAAACSARAQRGEN